MGFHKGQSGNPKGRPRKGKTLTDATRKVLQERQPDGETKGEAVARKLVELALVDGSVPAIKELYDRVEGRAVQAIEPTKVEVTGKDGGPIEHTVDHRVLLAGTIQRMAENIAAGETN